MKTLLVLVGPRAPADPAWRLLAERLLADRRLAGARVLAWASPSLALPPGAEELAEELARVLEREWTLAEGYEDVLVLATGAAGLVARRAWLAAAAAGAPWAGRLSRFVFLSTPHRGVDVPRPLLPLIAALDGLAGARRPLVCDLARGAVFVSRLEIVWSRHLRALGARAPVVVQLRAAHEPRVRRIDAASLEVAGAVHHEIAGADGRAGLAALRCAADPEAHLAALRAALLDASPPADPAPPRPPVDAVVLVLPGGRTAHAGWADALEAALSSTGRTVRVERAPYGRRSRLSLAVPLLRRRGLAWLRARAAHARAAHPEAQLVAMAHGAGTWIVARAVRELPELALDRTVLVGSLLPVAHRWRTAAHAPAPDVLHLVAARDLGVALAAGFLRGLGWRDVGASGLFGLTARDGVTERAWLDGGSGRALEEDELLVAARFLLDGERPAPEPWRLREYELSPWLARAHRAAAILALPLVALVIVLVVLAVA